LSRITDRHLSAVLDFQRPERIGISEAVLCEHKSPEQIENILQRFHQRNTPSLLTRLDAEKSAALSAFYRERLDYDPVSRTAFCPAPLPGRADGRVAIVSGGSSDAPAALEAARTLEFHGIGCSLYQDVGVTGLWRLLERIEAIREHAVVIAVAGMEGALFSALGGLVAAPLIAVPTSVGYGTSLGGLTALFAMLNSCVPGIAVVNIDNGFGAACLAHRINQGPSLNHRKKTCKGG